MPKVDKSIDKINLESNNIPKKNFEYNTVKFIDNSSDKKIDKILRDNTAYEETSNIFIDIRGGNYSTFIINTNPYLKIGNKLAVYSDLYIKLNSKDETFIFKKKLTTLIYMLIINILINLTIISKL